MTFYGISRAILLRLRTANLLPSLVQTQKGFPRILEIQNLKLYRNANGFHWDEC
jgi:hypothetical protein